MKIRYICPERCILDLPIELAINKYGYPHAGIACPTHKLYSKAQFWRDRKK